MQFTYQLCFLSFELLHHVRNIVPNYLTISDNYLALITFFVPKITIKGVDNIFYATVIKYVPSTTNLGL